MTMRPGTAQTCRETVSAGNWPNPARGWTAAILLTLAMFVSYVDRSILALLVDPIKVSLRLSDVQMGLLQGATFGLVFTLSMVPCGWLVDKVNRTRLLGGAIAVWSLMTAACAFPTNFIQMFLARMGVALGEAAVSPSAPSLIADYFPPEKRTPPLSLYGIGGIVGVAASLLFGGSLASLFGDRQTVNVPVFGILETWQMIFVSLAFPGLLLSLVFFVFLREPRRLEQSSTSGSLRELRASLGDLKGVIAPHIASFCLFNIFGQAMSGWLPSLFMRVHGWSMAEVGLRLGMIQLAAAILGAVAGAATARFLEKSGRTDANFVTATLFLSLTAPPAIFAAMTQNATLGVVSIGLCTACLMAPTGAILAAIQDLVPNRLRGRITSLYYVALGLISMTLGPLLIGMMNDYVFTDERAVGKSLAVVALATLPLSALLMALSGRNRQLRAGRA